MIENSSHRKKEVVFIRIKIYQPFFCFDIIKDMKCIAVTLYCKNVSLRICKCIRTDAYSAIF